MGNIANAPKSIPQNFLVFVYSDALKGYDKAT